MYLLVHLLNKRHKDKAIVNAPLHLQPLCLVQQITRENNVAQLTESSVEIKVSGTIRRLQHDNLLLINNTETPTQRFFDKSQANDLLGLLLLMLYYFILSGTQKSPLLSVLFLSYCETPATSSLLRFIEETTNRHLITSSATHDSSTFTRDL